MKPRELIGTARVPGGEELQLFRHDTAHIIMLGGNELMSSRVSGSEQQLALMTCEGLRGRVKPHLLIGGYGMGFTLRAALSALEADAKITVVELVPEIIAWARGPMATLTAGCLDDPRVTLLTDDVGAAITAGRKSYDAILLDVDNGPDGLTRSANDALYDTAGLAAAHQALRKGGVLAVWSSTPDAKFTARLKKAGFAVKEFPLRANGPHGGAKHFIWTATKAG